MYNRIGDDAGGRPLVRRVARATKYVKASRHAAFVYGHETVHSQFVATRSLCVTAAAISLQSTPNTAACTPVNVHLWRDQFRYCNLHYADCHQPHPSIRSRRLPRTVVNRHHRLGTAIENRHHHSNHHRKRGNQRNCIVGERRIATTRRVLYVLLANSLQFARR
jgi:hypothetical protein